METHGEMTEQKIPSGPREAFACSPWRMAKVKTTVKDLEWLRLWLNHLVLSTCNRCCSSRWWWHRRCGGSTISGDVHPRTLTLKTKLQSVSDFQTIATSWRSVVSRGHLGSSDFEGVLLAKDQTHRLSLSPDFLNCQLFRWQKVTKGLKCLTSYNLPRVTCLTPP